MESKLFSEFKEILLEIQDHNEGQYDLQGRLNCEEIELLTEDEEYEIERLIGVLSIQPSSLGPIINSFWGPHIPQGEWIQGGFTYSAGLCPDGWVRYSPTGHHTQWGESIEEEYKELPWKFLMNFSQ